MSVDSSPIETEANKQNSTPKEDWDVSQIDPADAPRAVREYLDKLDEAAFGTASEVQPRFTSHSDSASQWIAARISAVGCRDLSINKPVSRLNQ